MADLFTAADATEPPDPADFPKRPLKYCWPPQTMLRAPHWEPTLAEIEERLRDHGDYCGRAGMQPIDIAKDCDFLLQSAAQLYGRFENIVRKLRQSADAIGSRGFVDEAHDLRNQAEWGVAELAKARGEG